MRSLPAPAEPFTYIPAFPRGAAISSAASTEISFEQTFTFPQAYCTDGTLAKEYRVVIRDADGGVIEDSLAYAGMFRLTQTNYVTHTSQKGEKGERYTVTVTPISLFGESGDSITSEFVWQADSITSAIPMAPDILNVSVSGGVVSDATNNRYSIFRNGNATASGDKMVFDGQGNYRVEPFSSAVYSQLADGFTVEMRINTGSSVSGTQGYLSNKESGGFSVECGDGNLRFFLRCGSNYVHADAPIVKNTEYHVVCVFDGGEMRIYLNGELATAIEYNGTLTAPTVATANWLAIGSDCDGGEGESFSFARIYTARIYSGVLTYQNVVYLYQNR